MALTVRLGPRAERALNALARRRRMSRSDVVRDALARYESNEGGDETRSRRPYDAWIDVVGVVKLGVREPAGTTGKQFAELVRKQARARRAR
jgi:Arc/MetJ-type ribon-helix-helix transcriptional regulator